MTYGGLLKACCGCNILLPCETSKMQQSDIEIVTLIYIVYTATEHHNTNDDLH